METRHRIPPTIRQFARELRQPQTPAEATLWQHLRNRNLGHKFRRQHPMVCDQARTEYLETLGYKVIRFTNDDVRHNLHVVIANIIEAVEARVKELEKIVDHPSS